MRFALTAALLCVLSHSTAAEEPPLRETWGASPEAYFMTRAERREWELVKTDDDARRFIDAFRARRGAGFSAEVQRRAALVDERLALGEVKASSTLRGKIVILLGAPSAIHVKGIPVTTVGNVGHPLSARRGGAAADRPPQPNMIGNGAGWVEYTFRYQPDADAGIGPDGWTLIAEANAASGKDRLKYRRDRKTLERILETAARRSILEK